MDLRSLIEKKNQYAKFMVDEITYIIKNFEKRPPGSKGEKDAVEYMASLCEKPCNGNVKVEPFKLHPMAFFHWIWITGVCVVLALICSFFIPIVSVIATVIGFVVLTEQFVFYRTTFDKLFKQETSHNLLAIRKPTGEVKRRIFFNGHPDAAYEWTMNNWFGGVGFVGHAIWSGVGAFYVLFVSIAVMAVSKTAGYVDFNTLPLLLQIAIYIGLANIPCYIILFFMFNTSYCVDGANDNLTACLMAVAIVKALDDNDIKLENTEVGVILSGSEEGGLRGAKAFAKMHAGEFNDVPTYIIAYDTLHELDFLYVNERDLNLTVKADDYISGIFFKGCEDVGVRCYSGSIPLGATDSAAFNQAGMKATGITALNHNLQDYYHTRRDSYDNLDQDCLAAVFAGSIQALYLFDKGEVGYSSEERKSITKKNLKALKAEKKAKKMSK